MIKYHMSYHTCQNTLNFSVLTNFVQFNFERGSPQTVKKKILKKKVVQCTVSNWKCEYWFHYFV